MKYKIRLSEPVLGFDEALGLVKVLRSKQLSQGREVKKFEQKFSKFQLNSGIAVAVNSGTSALHLGLLSAKIGIGDEVIVPAFSFAATANSVVLTGATPVFADIDIETMCLSPESVKSKITKKTRAIIIVHLFGNMPNMENFLRICKDYKLLLIEDVAQALGSKYQGRYAGTFGEFGAFSFYPTKNLTTGEGGMIYSANTNLIRNSKLLRNQGMLETYENEIVGFNNRMTEFSASIGLNQIRRLDRMLKKRKDNAKFYLDNLKNVFLPRTLEKVEHSYNQFTIRVENKVRDKLIKKLSNERIETKIYYPKSINNLDAYKVKVDLPVTDIVIDQVLSIPIHPRLTERNLLKITKIINTNT